jgi:UDP-2-acetamido-2-deoxy-ribo-hexuluronate aminotransferase
MESIRVHSKGMDKYDNIRIGLNARLDTLQAVILIEKLKLLPGEIKARQAVAERYSAALAETVAVPQVPLATVSAWAQYTVLLPEGADRHAIQAELAAASVPSAVYYPAPLHEQSAYKRFPTAGALPTTAALTPRVLSLPMHPYLETEVQDEIIAACLSAFR